MMADDPQITQRLLVNCREAHKCHCDRVSACHIHTHPDPKVQRALNTLCDALTEYDSTSGSVSVLVVKSTYATGGQFHSVTRNTAAIRYRKEAGGQ
jgi:hypothetical protein